MIKYVFKSHNRKYNITAHKRCMTNVLRKPFQHEQIKI